MVPSCTVVIPKGGRSRSTSGQNSQSQLFKCKTFAWHFFFSHNSLINDLLLAFCLGCDDLDVKCSVFFMGCELQPNLVESKRPSIRRPAFLDAVSGPTFSTGSFKEAHAVNLQYIPHLHCYLDTHASSTGDLSASQLAHKLLARRQKKSQPSVLRCT